jgi:hypothetical protein
MTFEEMHRGTVPAVLLADGSSWRIWLRGSTACCKWIEGCLPEQTPFKRPLADIPELFDVDIAQLVSEAADSRS